MKYDICIIGAGILGTTLAYTLQKKYKCCVIETQSEPGLIQTSVNSSVIHSGIFYTEDQNILNFCLEGKEKIKSFCRKNLIHYRECGKKILCSEEKKDILITRAKNYGIKYKIEKDCIFLPEVALLSYKELANHLYYHSLDCVDYYFNAKPSNITNYRLSVPGKIIEYDILINLAGTSAIDIYREFSRDYSYTLCEIEGHFHEYAAIVSDWVHAPMIYKFPDEKLPFLGPHITPAIEPGFKLGPNAVPRIMSKTNNNNIQDIIVRKKFINQNNEFFAWNHKLKAGNFLEKECERIYGPKINKYLWHHNKVGTRSILLNQDGSPVNQFIIKKVDNTVHFLNSHSPAATSAFAIAEYILKAYI